MTLLWSYIWLSYVGDPAWYVRSPAPSWDEQPLGKSRLLKE